VRGFQGELAYWCPRRFHFCRKSREERRLHKKYFVFISSTLEDLKAERRELAKIITEMGAVPVVSDAFDIAQEDDRKLVRKAIEECDYFLNLTAHKGGPAAGSQQALELEYSYAVKAGIPVLALIIGEKARWKDSKKEKTAAAVKTLEAFKKKLRSHTHETWINMGDLKQKALMLLSREMNINPRRGWVPSTEAVEPSVANELSRLIRENETLRSQIKMEGTDIVKKVRKQIRQALKVLAANRISLSFYYAEGENWENTQVYRYLKLFRLLAPELSTSRTVAEISHFLGNILNPNLEKVVRKDYPTPSNTIKKIMADFTLLKLVKYSGSGDNEAWEMTEYGKETYTVYRLRQMEKGLAKSLPHKDAENK
jgi:hypothetical protein